MKKKNYPLKSKTLNKNMIFMQKSFAIAILTGCIFFAFGCGEKKEPKEKSETNSTDIYYNYDGGCINLLQVKVLSSGIEKLGWDGPRSVRKRLGPISEKTIKDYSCHLGGHEAYIEFDGVKVYLNGDTSFWIREYQRVEQKMKSLQTK